MSTDFRIEQEMLVKAAAEKDSAQAIKKMSNIIQTYDNRVKKDNPYDHEIMVSEFIDEASNKKGESVLHVAQSPDVVKYAVELSSELLYRVDNNGYTPAMTAVLQGKESVLKTLLDLDANHYKNMINATQYPTNKTALHMVLENKNLSEAAKERMVKTLLDYNADPTLKDSAGKDAISCTNNPKIKNMLTAAAEQHKTSVSENSFTKATQSMGLDSLQQFQTVNIADEIYAHNTRSGKDMG